jgi:hypothetical protein
VAIEPTGDAGRLRVRVRNEYSGRSVALEPVDLVVLSYGASAVDGLYRALGGKVPGLVLVADAMAPRLLHDAILEAIGAPDLIARGLPTQHGDYLQGQGD